MELPPVEVPIHVGIGEEDFCRAAFDNHIQHFRPAQLVEGLGRENHRGVCFSPRLERLDDVPLNARILQKHPCLIYEKRLEYGTDLPVANDGVRTMQNVEQEWFKNFGVLAHFLEVETLEARKGNRVFRIVEEESELAAACPLREPVRNSMSQRVCQNSKRSELWVNRIEILNLLVEIPFLARFQVDWRRALQQNLHKQGKKVEILLRRRKRERINPEVRGVDSYLHVRTPEKLREAFETASEVKNEGPRIIFLEISDKKVQKERFSGSSSSENHGVGHVPVMEV